MSRPETSPGHASEAVGPLFSPLPVDAHLLEPVIARARHDPTLIVDDIAMIVYTSGTTGRPKGCGLTHGNLRANVMQNLDAVSGMLSGDERSLLFLSLAHSFATMIALVGSEHGVTKLFATGLDLLREELTLAEPTMIAGLPQVFENGIQRRARPESPAGKGPDLRPRPRGRDSLRPTARMTSPDPLDRAGARRLRPARVEEGP